MAFNHRKLMLDSLNKTLNQMCKQFCDSNKTQDGACPMSCFPLCDHNCYRSLSQLLPPPPPPPPPPNISYDPQNKSSPLSLPLTISLSILVAFFSLFCCYAIYKCYKGWYRSRQVSQRQPEDDDGAHDDFLDEDHGPVVDHPIWYIRTVGLNPSVISAITICKYKKDEGIVEGTECSVCLNEFQEDETLRLLPKCNHAFHIPCIDTWLTSHTNCPLCRAGIVRSTTASPSPELVVGNSDRSEETHVGISENTEEEDEVEEEELGVENEIIKSEVDEFQPMRRSVSLDSSSAAMISAAIANVRHQGRSEDNSDTQLVKVNESNPGTVPKRIEVNQSLLRLMGSSSFARSLQRGPMFMKRSVSCSGKVLSSTTHGRNRNSILPP